MANTCDNRPVTSDSASDEELRDFTNQTGNLATTLSSKWVDSESICVYTRMRIYEGSTMFYVDP
jgi:hypothetical protein